ncbi:MAG: GTPase [Alphaproteobacteria bacterium]|nr:MAG: GTPase [Alphaproteobacteria bacterium]
MRLKIFTADNMKAALAQVREALGDDAIIINNVEEDGKVKITAAIEIPTARITRRRTPPPQPKPAPVQRSLKDLEQEDHTDSINLSYFLAHHGIEKTMMRRILETAASFDEDSNIKALAKALDIMFHFSPLRNDYQNRPVMLVGPPGVGKTVTTAKLTSQAVLSGQTVRLINTDIIRTGGTAQLEGYAQVLKTTVIEASEPDLLSAAIETNRQPHELVIIDTMGYNPFNCDEMAELHRFIAACDVEPILVVSAGSDPVEAQEIAETYMNLGVRRFIATRLDVARRYGSLLATAASMDLALAGVSITPYLAKGIEQINATSLARLLTRIPDRKIFVPPKKNRIKKVKKHDTP